MSERPTPEQVEAAAEALAAELADTVPVEMEGEGGWLEVAERALEAAAEAG